MGGADMVRFRGVSLVTLDMVLMLFCALLIVGYVYPRTTSFDEYVTIYRARAMEDIVRFGEEGNLLRAIWYPSSRHELLSGLCQDARFRAEFSDGSQAVEVGQVAAVCGSYYDSVLAYGREYLIVVAEGP